MLWIVSTILGFYQKLTRGKYNVNRMHPKIRQKKKKKHKRRRYLEGKMMIDIPIKQGQSTRLPFMDMNYIRLASSNLIKHDVKKLLND